MNALKYNFIIMMVASVPRSQTAAVDVVVTLLHFTPHTGTSTGALVGATNSNSLAPRPGRMSFFFPDFCFSRFQ